VIDGDPATDAQAVHGLNARLTGNQVISAGHQRRTDRRWRRSNQAIDRSSGDNGQKIIVCNKFVRRKITSLLLSSAGGAAVAGRRPRSSTTTACRRSR
jgi:hypothetical protein